MPECVIEDTEMGTRGAEATNFAFKAYMYAMFPSAVPPDAKSTERALDNCDRYTSLDNRWYAVQGFHMAKNEGAGGQGQGQAEDEEAQPKTQEEIDEEERQAGEDLVEIAKQVVEMQAWAAGQLKAQNEGHMLWWRSARVVLRRAFEVLMHDLRSLDARGKLLLTDY